MNRIDLAFGVLDLLEDGLEPLLELAPELRAGDQRAEVERDDALVLQTLGHVAADDPLGEALDDRGLADARLADQHRVVLRPPAQHLDDPTDLLVPADDRIELAGAGLGGQVAAVLLEGRVGALRVRRGDALAAADALQRLEDGLAVAPWRSRSSRPSPPTSSDAEEEVLGRDVLVAEPAGLGLRRARGRAWRAGRATASRPGSGPACRGCRRARRGTRAGRRRAGGGSRRGRRHRARQGHGAGARRRGRAIASSGRPPGRRRWPPGLSRCSDRVASRVLRVVLGFGQGWRWVGCADGPRSGRLRGRAGHVVEDARRGLGVVVEVVGRTTRARAYRSPLPSPAEVRHALALEPEAVAVLGPGRDAQQDPALERRHRDLATEERLRERQRQLPLEVGDLAA